MPIEVTIHGKDETEYSKSLDKVTSDLTHMKFGSHNADFRYGKKVCDEKAIKVVVDGKLKSVTSLKKKLQSQKK